MKIYCLFIFILLITNCSQNNSNNENPQLAKLSQAKELTNKINVPFESGIFSLNLLQLLNSEKSFSIYNLDKTEYIRISNPVIFKGQKFDPYDEEYLLRPYMNIRVFELEYHLLICDYVGKHNDMYKVIVNDSVKLVEFMEGVTKFETIEEHLLNVIPMLQKDNLVRLNPSEESDTIPNYMNYFFMPTNVKGDWLELQSDTVLNPLEINSNVSGWVKWREGDSILFKFAYTL